MKYIIRFKKYGDFSKCFISVNKFISNIKKRLYKSKICYKIYIIKRKGELHESN